MKIIDFDISQSASLITDDSIQKLQPHINLAHQLLHEKTGPGKEYLGWLELPSKINKEEIERIKEAALAIREQSDVLVVIGIGGSYLGARAVLELLQPSRLFGTQKGRAKELQVVFAGHQMDADYLYHLKHWLKGKEFSINVISKSGTTTEPAIAFRIFRQLLEERYGDIESRKRIYVTTDARKGALKNLADEKGYQSFIIPDDVGGRYSVFTPVGTLPIAAAGIDIDELLCGAAKAEKSLETPCLKSNAAYRYAAYRSFLYQQGKSIEILASFDSQYHYLCEWWKQLFGESEGKEKKGIFPTSLQYTTDLHSMGQYVQDGRRIVFETVIKTEESKESVLVPDTGDNNDGLEYLKNKELGMINNKALEGTIMAHIDGGVPVGILSVPEKSAFWIGYLMYFFQKSCAISGYMLGVNPFDQPGVEDYKRNMFSLLGKPGTEQLRQELEVKWKK
ncbi:glucose-6-phosphate isomerase [Tindallia californiensis]|uniref:Glucose-6-phosphate isomerase n=1 Tax=Tindallia californiensis TaxID=159292 RepID=A0A1H3JUY3_9FIRM|nr:glucose-6-phosphate isomerase [Tindallia californiensis]SDY43780.1 glucose-6-phosphate isomerase [Tindallia californiensis]